MEERHVVPTELVTEGETILELLREAAKAQGKEADLYLLTAKSSKGFDPVSLSAAVLLIGGTSASWLTAKWVDTYLWPLVQSRIDAPSRKFIDWLGSKLPGENSGAVVPGSEPR